MEIGRTTRGYLLQGSVTFNNDIDGTTTFTLINNFLTTNSLFMDYGVVYLTDNTHHYRNPLPDNITVQGEQKIRSNTDKYELQR